MSWFKLIKIDLFSYHSSNFIRKKIDYNIHQEIPYFLFIKLLVSLIIDNA